MILSVLKNRYCLKTGFWVIGYVFLRYLVIFFNQFFYLEEWVVVLSPVDASRNSVDKRGNSSWAEV